MTTPVPGLITAYLLARLADAGLILLIIAVVACPAVWSQDAGRRVHARDALRLLISLFTGRRIW